MAIVIECTISEHKITDYEKIGSIARCNLQGISSGHFGKAIDISHNTRWTTRIEVLDGPCVLIRTTSNGETGTWQVLYRGMIGEDTDLEEAARLALSAGQGVQVTRDFNLMA